MLVVIVRLIVVIVRTSNGECIELVVSRSRSDVSITRSPIDGALHDGWPVQHRAPARKAPEVVVAGTDEERAAFWIDRRRLPHRSAAVSPLLTAVVGHVEGLPEHRAGPGVERDHAA